MFDFSDFIELLIGIDDIRFFSSILDMVSNKEKYFIARDFNQEILFVFQDRDFAMETAKKHLSDKTFDMKWPVLKSAMFKKNSTELKSLLQYQLVILDGEFALYSDVVEKSIDHIVDQLDDEYLNHGLDEYKTVSKR